MTQPNNQSSTPHQKHQYWSAAENDLLLSLRANNLPWSDTQTHFPTRSLRAIQQHHTVLKNALAGSNIAWTTEQDTTIISGKRDGLTNTAIGSILSLSKDAVADRWMYMKQANLVPQAVLAVTRRREVAEWSAEEDRMILKLYIAGLDDQEIIESVKAMGWRRAASAIVKRRQELVAREGGGGMFKEMLGVGKGGDEIGVDEALGKALGTGKKYEWMK